MTTDESAYTASTHWQPRPVPAAPAAAISTSHGGLRRCGTGCMRLCPTSACQAVKMLSNAVHFLHMLRAGARGEGPYIEARVVTGSSTLLSFKFTDTQTFEPEKHGQACSGMPWRARQCAGTVTAGRKRPSSFVTSRQRAPPGRSRLGGSNNPQ